MFNGIWNDLQHAGRSLAKARAFTVVCVLSLGIGMVPVMAVPYFTRIVTLPPQGLKTEGLVELVTTPSGPRYATAAWSYPDYADLRTASTGITLIGWTYGQSEFESTTVRAMFVSRNYFETIGVPLARGSGFSATSGPAVILGYNYWKRRFTSDPDIVGKTVTLDGVPHVVCGIAADGYEGHLSFSGSVAVFLPLEEHPRFRSAGTDRSNQWVYMHGRLAGGVSVAQASEAVSAATSSLARQYPSTNENRVGMAAPYSAVGALSEIRIIRTVGLTLTGMVLLVVCLNISGMMQVRSAMRERELSIRQAIGATRRQLMRYLLSEAVILAALGAFLASLVLFNLPSILGLLTDDPIPPQILDALKLNLPTLEFCVGLCFLTTLVFGLLPAVRFSRPTLITSLKDDAGVGGRRAGRIHKVTAALQVAIAVPLIVTSGISLDRVRATATADLGFAADLLYGVPLKVDNAKVANAELRLHTVRDNLAAADGVAAVTLADGLPLDFRGRMTRTALRPDADAAPRFFRVQTTRVDDDYLSAMGIPLLQGRGLSADDRAGTEPVAVISKTLAERLLPDAEPGAAIGQRLLFGGDFGPDEEYVNAERTQQVLTVVGVTGDFPTSQMSSGREQLLLPLAQHPSQEVFLIARSAPGEPAQKMTAALENAALGFNPESHGFGTTDGVAYPKVVTGAWLRKFSMDDFLTQSAALAGVGGVILMLSALGIYGVVGLMVATRTRELAVRLALGASRRRVLRMILFDVVKLVLPGVLVGLILTAAFIRVNPDGMGIPLSNVENVAYVAGAAVAVLIAVFSSLAPARRAASIEPMIAMRSE